MSTLLQLSLRNFKRQKRRNLATMTAVACGFAGMLLLGGYLYRTENLLRITSIYSNRNGHILIYEKNGLKEYQAKPELFSLSASKQESIKAISRGVPEILQVGSILQGQGLIGNGCRSYPFMAKGVEPELEKGILQHPDFLYWARNSGKLLKGDYLDSLPAEQGPLLLTGGLAHLLKKNRVHSELNLNPNDPLKLADCEAADVADQLNADANVQLMANAWDGQLSILDGEIVGLYFSGKVEQENTALIAPLSHLQKLYVTDHVTYMTVWLHDSTKIDSVLEQLENQFKQAELNLDLYRWDDERVNQFYSGSVSFLYTMVTFISCVLLLIIVLSIFNAITITVLDRRREIGMFRALGFKAKTMRKLFLMENGLLSLAAIVLGGLGAYLVMITINAAEIYFQPPAISTPIQLILVPNLNMILASALIVFVLSMLAARLAVHRTLKRPITTLLATGAS